VLVKRRETRPVSKRDLSWIRAVYYHAPLALRPKTQFRRLLHLPLRDRLLGFGCYKSQDICCGQPSANDDA
jgi:hypothetical protein